MSFNKSQIEKLEKSGYRFVGKHGHAAVKTCHWTRQSISDKGVCYKEKFYGIQSHRCLQMSPAVPNCQQECEFCWRDLTYTQTTWEDEEYDEPKVIVDEAIKAQNNLMCGFYGNDKANKKKLEEMKHPNNAAISLAGEPTLYPKIDELIGEFNRYGTSFAAVLDKDSVSLDECSFEGAALAVVGNEGNGLTEDTVKACTHKLYIPMSGKAESLNVSAAASIILWEMKK